MKRKKGKGKKKNNTKKEPEVIGLTGLFRRRFDRRK